MQNYNSTRQAQGSVFKTVLRVCFPPLPELQSGIAYVAQLQCNLIHLEECLPSAQIQPLTVLQDKQVGPPCHSRSGTNQLAASESCHSESLYCGGQTIDGVHGPELYAASLGAGPFC